MMQFSVFGSSKLFISFIAFMIGIKIYLNYYSYQLFIWFSTLEGMFCTRYFSILGPISSAFLPFY